MRTTCGLFAACAMALAACTPPEGGTSQALPQSAGEAGPGYCEGPPPADAAGMERWNRLCFPER